MIVFCGYENRHGPCTNRAAFIVLYANDLPDAKRPCAKHLARAVRDVATEGGLLAFPVSVHVRPLRRAGGAR